MFIYFDEEGKCFWSDTDYTIQDQIPYYPAPEGVEIGTRCKIIDGVAVADPIPQNEIDEANKKVRKEVLTKIKIEKANKICEKKILEKYSRDKQRNIDRDALHLKALEAIDATRLKPDEIEWLKTHKEMSRYINEQLGIARTLKSKIKTLSLEELESFNVEGNYAS